ncbi:hypothetical protein N7495_005355 [Penicillium taxi]|uniref:uncharacterized protein n=1 Tax=Penicillium taxi TaxID=168475 RepID=UPI002545A422|nr:uncharacterized protein N7495_005355 [Penicillium taxi]KAJ5893664.1 hypothetical protein N7495_005355 [Penicillium taxi]
MSATRVVVPVTDNSSIPILGIAFTILGSGISQFFSLLYPFANIVALVAELLAYLIDVCLLKLLPLTTFRIGCLLFSTHIIMIMDNDPFGSSSTIATNIIQASSRAYYNLRMKPSSTSWLFSVTTAMLWSCGARSPLADRAGAYRLAWRSVELRHAAESALPSKYQCRRMVHILSTLLPMRDSQRIRLKNVVINQLFGMQTGLRLRIVLIPSYHPPEQPSTSLQSLSSSSGSPVP